MEQVDIKKRTIETGDEKIVPKDGDVVEIQCEEWLVTEAKPDDKSKNSTFSSKRIHSLATGKLGRTLVLRLGSNNIIPACDNAIRQLAFGEKALFVIPADRAYDKHGYPGIIPPDSEVHLIIKLVSIRR